MPTYEYRCTKCDHVFDRFQKVGDPAPACPVCGSPTRKVYSSVGLVFKGKGFHTTDYRKPAPAEDGETKPAAAKDTSAGAKDTSTTSKDTSTPTKGASPKGASPASSASDS